MRLVVHVDGGARGNPGPAAVGVVVDDERGERLETIGERIGHATNNVAEYRAVLRGLQSARRLGADSVELIGDSELVVNQLNGVYRVRNAALKPLYEQARTALGHFSEWSVRAVPRAQNAEADALVNRALDAAPSPPDAGGDAAFTSR